MEPIERLERVREVLARRFPGAEFDLELSVPSRKVGGFVIWPGFEGKEQIDRQQLVWQAIRGDLSRDDQLQITAILTVTPNEMAIMKEG